MNKIKTNKYVSIGVLAFLLYLAIRYWDALFGFVLVALRASSPLIFGLISAYVINILMTFYEKHFFPKCQKESVKKLRRILCLIFAFFSVGAIIVIISVMIIPELVSCLKTLIEAMPKAINSVYVFLNEKFHIDTVISGSTKAILSGNFNYEKYLQQFFDKFVGGIGGAMTSITTVVSSVFSTTLTVVVGLVFSVYLLSQKEKLKGQADKLLFTYVKEKYYIRIKYFTQTLNNSFNKFIVGQCTEAVILGALCIMGMTIFRFPYATMIGTLVGFTALIPIAGAYIGAIVGAIMIFTISPVQALLFLIFLIVLQQIEGNLIYPKVVGSSIGLPGIWVLAAITVGGGILGIGGMLIGVPIVATIYRVLHDDVRKRNGEVFEE